MQEKFACQLAKSRYSEYCPVCDLNSSADRNLFCGSEEERARRMARPEIDWATWDAMINDAAEKALSALPVQNMPPEHVKILLRALRKGIGDSAGLVLEIEFKLPDS